MKNFDQLLDLTVKNTVKKQTVSSVNSNLVSVLLDKELTKPEAVTKLSIIRYQEQHGEIDMNDPEFQARWHKINITIGNGFDTSVSNSNNTSSFNNNPEYNKNYKVVKTAAKKFTIVKL